jgi:HEAT repeat protein
VLFRSLLKVLADPDAEVRRQVATSLGRLGKASDEVVEALLKALADPDAYVRRQVASGLGQLGKASDEVVEALLKALADPDAEVPWQATTSLGRLGKASDEIVEILLKALADPDVEVRRQATTSLGQLDKASDEVVQALLEALADPDVEVRTQAATSLGQLGKASDEIVPILLELAHLHESWLERQKAVDIISHVGPSEEQIIHHLLQGLLDADNDVRESCAKGLAKLGQRFPTIAEEIAKKLKDALEEPEFDTTDNIEHRSAHDYAFSGLWQLMNTLLALNY